MTGTNLTIGISAGDPAGIGPEVLVKALAERPPQHEIVIYGAGWSIDEALKIAGITISPDYQIVDPSIPHPDRFRYGEASATCGMIGVVAVETAARDAMAGRIDAMVTCPLNKEAIRAAGYEDIGHQEILGRLTQANETATMLMTPGLRVVHMSTHKSLAEAVRFITTDTVMARVELCHRTFEKWGMKNPRIAVAAVNPHGGEGGLLGREEIDVIAPAVRKSQQQGIDATGPLPADSVFNRAIEGEFDVVLAMYHDQGHIAIKVKNFHDSASATLGIPFVRTSVDHGTAFDIAGRGIANPRSTHAAIQASIDLASGKLGSCVRAGALFSE